MQLIPAFGWESMILGIPGWLSKGVLDESRTLWRLPVSADRRPRVEGPISGEVGMIRASSVAASAARMNGGVAENGPSMIRRQQAAVRGGGGFCRLRRAALVVAGGRQMPTAALEEASCRKRHQPADC
jgi:hypothetical protein